MRKKRIRFNYFKKRSKKKYRKLKFLFRYPIFYFVIYKTIHNLFLTVYFCTGKTIASVTSGLAGFSGKKGLSPATARVVAKLLVEKFFQHKLVRRYDFFRYGGMRKFGYYFKRNFFTFLRKRTYKLRRLGRFRNLYIKRKKFFFKLFHYKKSLALRLVQNGDRRKYFVQNVKKFTFIYRILLKKRKPLVKKKKLKKRSKFFFNFFSRSFKKLNKYKRRLHYLKVFSFSKFLRRFSLLLRKKGKKLIYRRNIFLHERARLYKLRKIYKKHRKIPFSIFFLNCYPDSTVKAAIRTIVANIPFFYLFISTIPIAHNGVRGAKRPRK